jgi:hypothetical protein
MSVEPDWINRDKVVADALTYDRFIGSIWKMEAYHTKHMWIFPIWALKIAEDEFRFAETKEDLEAMRVLRGLENPIIKISEKFGVGFAIISHENSVRIVGGS